MGKIFVVLLPVVLSLALAACGSTSAPSEEPSTVSSGAGTVTVSPTATADATQEEVTSPASDRATVSDKATYAITTPEKSAARQDSAPDATATPIAATQRPTARPTATVPPTGSSGDLAFGNNVDDQAVLFTLPSAQGAEYSLAQFKGDKNVVLVFYRAFW